MAIRHSSRGLSASPTGYALEYDVAMLDAPLNAKLVPPMNMYIVTIAWCSVDSTIQRATSVSDMLPVTGFCQNTIGPVHSSLSMEGLPGWYARSSSIT